MTFVNSASISFKKSIPRCDKQGYSRNTVKNYEMKHVDVNLQILTYEISENSSPYINNDKSTAVCFFHPIALESQIQVCKSEHTLIFFTSYDSEDLFLPGFY